ncbi:hypothetical protein DMB66_23975 [Actinoplanes sp. ATCC 53533]|uniref:hypothetical protein n=1 Tax=Actinoplanes sp. ATCC 53533 TaxID=1288362 RepID=UPI000F7ABAD9|nr:hypothetical protein [Actinoplanes sp. ATCC 53533]RSM61761.1 hypothetical protein DMB66_23975 [Actinoplanes sp. ATCC 53533]
MLDLDAVEQTVARQLTLLDPSHRRGPLDETGRRANGGRTLAELIARYGTPGPSMPVQLCCGMGVDTAVIVTELIENEDARVLLVADADGRERLVRIELSDVDLVTAMTGNEFDETQEAMEHHLLPVIRRAGLRYVQISRAGQSQEDGIVILDDSRAPQRMFMRGPWALEDELATAGTVPQTAAASRRCSYRAKGWPLDTWATAEYGTTERIHIMGFASEETARVQKDLSYSRATRRSVYPRQWGYDRQLCLEYLRARYGIEWPRSCCGYFPFAGGSRAKNARIAERWRAQPSAGVLSIWLELLALALNPRMALFKTSTAWQVAHQHGLDRVLAAVQERLNASRWAIYDVRRVFRPHGAKLGVAGDSSRKGRAWRSTHAVHSGSRAEMVAEISSARDGSLDPGITPRRHLVVPRNVYPSCERFLVAAPLAVADKEERGFHELWESTIAAQGTTRFAKESADV